MKTIYKLLIFILFIFVSNSIYSQITVVDAVAIDGDGDGFYGTVEIAFSTKVDDSDITKNDDAKDDWEFSFNPDFPPLETETVDHYDTEVSNIASVNVSNDSLISLILTSQLSSSSGTIYFRYTNGGNDVRDKDHTGAILDDFALKTATDASPPAIQEILASAVGGSILKVGDKVDFTITLKSEEYGLTFSQNTFNGGSLTWLTSDGINYTSTYTVAEGHTELTEIQLIDITLEDEAGNISNPSSSNTLTNDIDSDTPGISGIVVAETGTGTSIVGDVITFTLTLTTPETGLTVTPTTYNGQNLNWDTSDPNTYVGEYTVTEGDNDQSIAVNLSGIILSDDAGNTSNSVDGVVTLGIDANTPAITDITASTTGGSILKVGDEVEFEITVATPEYGLTVNTTGFNGGTLAWSTIDGSTYTSIYTVEEGQSELSSVQLTGVTLSDAAGNESSTDNSNILTNNIDSNFPVISSVYLKNKSKKIGDEDTLHITITADADYSNYTLVPGGTVAGYTLKSITKVNSTTIQALFDIDARTYDIDSSATVQVSNLQLADGAGNVSNLISSSISNSQHAIFSKKPIANIGGSESICHQDSIEVPIFLNGYAPFSITYTDGFTPVTVNSISTSLYKLKIIANESIGNLLTYTITDVTDATGNSNTGDGSFTLTIYSLPTASFTNPTNGNNFDISQDTVDLIGNFAPEGTFSGDGVLAATDQFSPSLAGLGFHDLNYAYEDANGCKDSETITIKVIEGGTITFEQGKNIYCSYTDTFSVTGLNNFAEPGTFSLIGDPGGALINITIDSAIVKPELLTPGSWSLKYSYPSGEPIVSSFVVEEVDPSITFTPIGDHCEDYETIEIEAKNLSPLGGNGYFTFSDIVDLHKSNNGNSIYFNPGDLTPNGTLAKSYTLEYFYITQNGCSSDTVTEVFDINPLPNVSLPMDGEYNLYGGLKTITPNIPHGTYGPTNYWSNITANTGDFDPEQAELGIDTTWYTYTDPTTGCTNIDSAFINVKEPNVVFTGLNKFTYESETKNQYCFYNSKIDTITVNPSEPAWTDKKFFIDDVQVVIFAEDSILLDPGLLSAGNHIIKYTYKEVGVDYEIEGTFNIDSIADVNIEGLVTDYCKEDISEIDLEGKYPAVEGLGKIEFSGNGIINGIDDEYAIFIPANAALGDNPITCQFTRDYSGCTKNSTEIVTVNKTPDINFELDKVCVVDKADSVLFTSDTLMSDNVVEWFWRVNNSETIRESDTDSSKFSLVPQNNNLASLTLTTDKGCTSFKEKTIFIGSRVDLDFTWDKECNGETVTFEVLDRTDPLGVDSIKWNFGGLGVEDLTDEYNPQFTYDNPGGYDVEYQEYTNTCDLVTKSKRIFIRPSIIIGTDSYIEDFEQASEVTGWAVDLASVSSSWEWGVPSGEKINSAPSGSNAFVTNLNGDYNSNEKSFVSSPCFDFSALKKPMIKFDFISALEVSRDGVILEYSINKDEWNSVGVYGEGVRWYNSFNLTGNSLGQSSGWNSDGLTLNPSASDTLSSWNNAKYWLDEIAGNTGVRFRFVLASDGYIEDEGFGFDNVWIGDRKRLVLLEHFANDTDEDEFDNAQSEITSIFEDNPQDVIPIQFFTSFPTTNDISNFYTAGPSARSLYYGVSQVPYSIVDGGNRQFSHADPDIVRKNVNKRMLEESKFQIKVVQEDDGNNLNIKATITAIDTVEKSKLSARIVVVEKSVDSYINVVRTMLPDPAGVLMDKSWEINDSINIYQSWETPVGINKDNLITIVYVQYEGTDEKLRKEIYQAGYTDTFGNITSINDDFKNILDVEYVVYPNPVNDLLKVKLYKSLTYDLDINIYNNIGALVKSEKLYKGNIQKEINTNDLPVGIYYLKLGNTDKLFGTKKIIKSN